MQQETTQTPLELDVKVAKHKRDKRNMQDFKSRRFHQWNENYALFRDKVDQNRLTQRQKVNVPMIKEALKAWVANIDEIPEMTFKTDEKGNDYRDKEIKLNELWNKFRRDEYIDIKDQASKKIVGLQGVSFMEIGWSRKNNFPYLDLKDPYDVLLEKGSDPFDLQKHRTVKIINIFKPLQEIIDNETYDEEARRKLKQSFMGGEGLIRGSETDDSYEMKENRLREQGAQTDESMESTYKRIELNISYDLVFDKKTQTHVRYYRLYAADTVCLLDKPIEEVLGWDFIPLTWWNVDPDINDPWTDGYADNMRPLNKVSNVYFSQDLENRAIRNFGMYFYNNMDNKFVPQAIDPKPFGMYGVPGKPQDIMMQMDIQPLADTAGQVQYLKELAQASVQQPAVQRGVASGAKTLGEVQSLERKSNQMNFVDTKHYRKCWTEIAEMFVHILDIKQTSPIKLLKENKSGELYSQKVNKKDWAIGTTGESSKKYQCIPVFKKDKEEEDNFQIQKSQYVMNAFPNNPVALKIAKKKQLESLGWTSQEVEAAIKFEEQMAGQQKALGAADPTLEAQQMRNEGNVPMEGLQGQMKQQ